MRARSEKNKEMASGESSDESCSSEISKENPTRASSARGSGKFKNESSKHKSKLKLKPLGGFSTFIVPEILCQCQQRCTERVTPGLIQKICMYFYGLRGSKEKQKSYLASLILAKEKQIDINAMKGKRIRKMSYRYFVPVLTDEDLKNQSLENNIFHYKNTLSPKSNKHMENFIQYPKFKDKNWDHIEVCLKAFTTVHLISEKKVIVTRSVYTLKSSMRCSKPFNKDGSHSTPVPKDNIIYNIPPAEKKDVSYCNQTPGTSDVGAETAAWLKQYTPKNTKFPINPNTFLPEGLILPDSIDCVPIFENSNYNVTVNDNTNNDVDIIDNFFLNQLWKPEFISDCGSSRKPKQM